MISPQLLEAHAIPVVRCTQEPGEFMINFPGAYHAGFNHGWNCAESTNFATRAWVAVGARARACECSPDSVTIQMELFLPHANPATKKVILDNLPSDSESESEEEEEEEEEDDEMSDDDVSATPSAASGGVRSVSEASSRGGGGHHHHAASSDDDDCCARSPVRAARGRPSKAALAAAAKKSRSGKRMLHVPLFEQGHWLGHRYLLRAFNDAPERANNMLLQSEGRSTQGPIVEQRDFGVLHGRQPRIVADVDPCRHLFPWQDGDTEPCLHRRQRARKGPARIG